MSMEWPVPSEDRSSGSKRTLWLYVAAAVLVMAVAGGVYLALAGGEEAASEDVLFGEAAAEGGGGASDDEGGDAAPAASEDATAGASVADTETDAAGGEDGRTATEGLDLDIGEEALVFDSSFVTGIAAAVSQQVFPDGEAENVILASDQPTGDALAAGSLVGLFDTTLLLTDTDELSPTTAAEVDRLGNPRVHILGGTDVVSADVESELVSAGHDVHRHAGPRSASTAVDIAGAHFPDARTAVLVRTPDRMSGPVDAIATALAATSLAAAQDLPVLMTGGDALTDTTEMYLDGSLIRQVIVVGNEDDISDEVTGRIREIGIDWLRWGGEDRYATAVDVARNRGFSSLDDADVVVLVEGGHDAVWPAGFLGVVQAAHENGPAVLTDGNGLPPATADYLETATAGAVDVLCTPGVTRRACAEAMSIVDGGTAR